MSTIGGSGLNFRVRNENGCTPNPKAPTLRIQSYLTAYHIFECRERVAAQCQRLAPPTGICRVMLLPDY